MAIIPLLITNNLSYLTQQNFFTSRSLKCLLLLRQNRQGGLEGVCFLALAWADGGKQLRNYLSFLFHFRRDPIREGKRNPIFE